MSPPQFVKKLSVFAAIQFSTTVKFLRVLLPQSNRPGLGLFLSIRLTLSIFGSRIQSAGRCLDFGAICRCSQQLRFQPVGTTDFAATTLLSFCQMGTVMLTMTISRYFDVR